MSNTFKRQIIFVMLMMLGCFYAKADDGLITQQVTIKLDEAGTLPNKIGSSKKYKITNLKIIGDINGTDIRMIRDMAGRLYDNKENLNKETPGKLSTLDLSEARIVEGGDYYFKWTNPDSDKDIRYGYTSPNQIGDLTFCFLTKLTTITLPTNITSIGGFAFGYCTGLTSINIPEGVTEIVGGQTFFGCTGLTSINIPKSVTKISGNTFEGCTGLTSINIPEGVTEIDEDTFYGCTGLTSINIPKSVTSIGSYAFYGCTGLTSINIPEGVTEICHSAFNNCTGLTSINIPASVTSIGSFVFNGCTGLTSIYSYRITPLSVNSSTFIGIDQKSCTLYVPTGSYQDYRLADYWDDFDNIIEFDPTGIAHATTNSEATEVSRYTLDGQKLNTPSKGMNIVKYSDGTVKKVVVK